MTRVLVTRGSGFIGRHLVSALVARGRQTRVLDLHPPTHALPDVQYVEGSVLDPDLVDEALSGVGEVYHLAGLPGMWIPDKNNFHAVNCRSTEVVIAGRRHLHIPVPGRFAETATAILEFIADHVTRRPPSGTAEGARIALRATALSIEKAQRELGYAPRPVEPALRETIAYLLGAR